MSNVRSESITWQMKKMFRDVADLISNDDDEFASGFYYRLCDLYTHHNKSGFAGLNQHLSALIATRDFLDMMITREMNSQRSLKMKPIVKK